MQPAERPQVLSLQFERKLKIIDEKLQARAKRLAEGTRRETELTRRQLKVRIEQLEPEIAEFPSVLTTRNPESGPDDETLKAMMAFLPTVFEYTRALDLLYPNSDGSTRYSTHLRAIMECNHEIYAHY